MPRDGELLSQPSVGIDPFNSRDPRDDLQRKEADADVFRLVQDERVDAADTETAGQRGCGPNGSGRNLRAR